MAEKLLHDDFMLPADEAMRDIARGLYDGIKDLPLISPHGHTDPAWFAENQPFPDPAQLIVVPDHYVFRMLASQGISLDAVGVPISDGSATETDSRKIWQIFADNYHLLRATPSRIWLDHSFQNIFGLTELLTSENAQAQYDHIAACLARDEFRPRALFERFNLEVIATTESALDTLPHHQAIRDSGWSGRVVSTYRPDAVVDPDFEGFSDNIDKLGQMTGCDVESWHGYLDAHRQRRAFFKSLGTTATDHGHPSATTANLDPIAAAELYQLVLSGGANAEQRDLFRGQMLTELARMSIDDGLVMQLHPGSMRNHNQAVFARFGRDKGFDIPTETNYVTALKPLLDAVGDSTDLTVILFTLDETAYSRELAPLAGAYPCLKLGPAWWFYDSYEGMKRYREQVTETAGFYNTVGFNDDTRAFPSIPARHDVARRVDSAYLAELVATHRLKLNEAEEVAADLAYGLAKAAYNL